MFQNTVLICLTLVLQIMYGTPLENQIATIPINNSLIENLNPIVNQFNGFFKNILDSPNVLENAQHYIKNAVDKYKQKNRPIHESVNIKNSTEYVKRPYGSQSARELNDLIDNGSNFLQFVGNGLQELYQNAKPLMEKTSMPDVYKTASDAVTKFKNYISTPDEEVFEEQKQNKTKKKKKHHNAEPQENH